MPWWDKALKSVSDGAERAAFEADKLVRSQREQAAAADLKNKVQGKLAELGQAALGLYRAGKLTDPSIAALAAEIAGMEAQLKEQESKAETVRAEQWQGGSAESDAVAAAPAAPSAPVGEPAPAAPPPPAAAAPETMAAQPAGQPPEVHSAAPAAATPSTVECPTCHAQIRSTAVFCPECGNKVK